MDGAEAVSHHLHGGSFEAVQRKGWRSNLGVAPLTNWDMSSPVMALRVMPRR